MKLPLRHLVSWKRFKKKKKRGMNLHKVKMAQG